MKRVIKDWKIRESKVKRNCKVILMRCCGDCSLQMSLKELFIEANHN